MRYDYNTNNRTNPVRVNNQYPNVMKVNGRPVFRMRKSDKGLIYEHSRITATPFTNITNDNRVINRGYLQNPPVFTGSSYGWPILASSSLIWKRVVEPLKFKYTFFHYLSDNPIKSSYLHLTYNVNQTTPVYRKEGTISNNDDLYYYAIHLEHLNTNNPKLINYLNFPYNIEYSKSKRQNIPWYVSKIIPTFNSTSTQYLTYEINNHTLNNDADNVYSFEYSIHYTNRVLTDSDIKNLRDTDFTSSNLVRNTRRLNGRRLNQNYGNFTDLSITDRNATNTTALINIVKWLKDSFNGQTIVLNNEVITLKDIGYTDSVFNVNNTNNFINGTEFKNKIGSSGLIVLRLKVTNHLLNESKYYYFKANLLEKPFDTLLDLNIPNLNIVRRNGREEYDLVVNNASPNHIFANSGYANNGFGTTGVYMSSANHGFNRRSRFVSDFTFNNWQPMIRIKGKVKHILIDKPLNIRYIVSKAFGNNPRAENLSIGKINNSLFLNTEKDYVEKITVDAPINITLEYDKDPQYYQHLNSIYVLSTLLVSASKRPITANINVTNNGSYNVTLIYSLPDMHDYFTGRKFDPYTIEWNSYYNNANLDYVKVNNEGANRFNNLLYLRSENNTKTWGLVANFYPDVHDTINLTFI